MSNDAVANAVQQAVVEFVKPLVQSIEKIVTETVEARLAEITPQSGNALDEEVVAELRELIADAQRETSNAKSSIESVEGEISDAVSTLQYIETSSAGCALEEAEGTIDAATEVLDRLTSGTE